MQINEINNEALKREYEIIVDSKDVNKRYEEELEKARATMNLPGFRKGKVPKSMAKTQYHDAIKNKILNDIADESVQKITEEKKVELAVQPKLDINDFDENSELKYKLSVEVLPEVTIPAFGDITLEKLVAEVTDKDIEESLDKIAKSKPSFVDAKDTSKAANGDAVIMNFEGKIDNVPFPDGKAEDFKLVLGSSTFIPGFEEQLVGLKKNDTKIVKVKFPETYHVASLANQDAEFDVTIKQVQNVTSPIIDDEFAEGFGLKDLAELKNTVKERITKDSEAFVKNKMRKILFDKLEAKCEFLVPESLMKNEFDTLWNEYLRSEEKDPAKSEEEMKKIYTDLSSRRIKLGILITEIAKINKIQIEQNDIKAAIFEQARQYPGQEHLIMDHYRNNPKSLEALKGPILENKVVDFIFDKISYDERKLPFKELIELADKENS